MSLRAQEMDLMSAHLRCSPSCRRAYILSIVSAVLIFVCPDAAPGQITKMYSFEPDLEGFAAVGGGLTVSQETSGLGATDGANSMKLEFTDFSSFAGARTSNIHAAFNDPLGVDFVRFDLTNTN